MSSAATPSLRSYPQRRPTRAPAALVALGAAVAALMLVPVAYLAVRAAGADDATWDLIVRPRTLWLAIRSAGLAIAVTFAAVTLGVPLAWLTTRTDLPLRRLWGVTLALPLVIPSYVGAFALLAALGPRGMLQGMLEGPLGIERLPDIGGFPGAFLSLTLFTYPFVYLLVAAGIRALDPSLEEAAHGLGHSSWSTFRRVTLPLLRPPIAAGGLLVALYTLHDFGAVSLMRYEVFTHAIYLQYKGAFDRTPAAILSLMLVGLALAAVVAQHRWRGRARLHRSGAGTARPLPPIALERWRTPAILLCASTTLVALALPVSVILFWVVRAVTEGDTVRVTGMAALGSVGVAAAGAVLALAAGLPVALLAARHPGRSTRLLERGAYAGYALPGIVVALALVFFAANYAPGIYQSLPLVVIAYVVLFLPQASEPLRTSLLQIAPRIEEAGRALGRSRSQVFVRVVAPLISRGAVAGFALVFLTAMKELPATLLLRPTGFETLSTRVWTGASAGLYSKAAAPALMLVLLCAIPLYVLARRVQVQDMEV